MPDFRLAGGAWSRLPIVWRFCAVACVLIALAAVPAVFLLTRDHNVSLFAEDLDPQQIAEVDAQLAAWNILHVTTAASITVDADRRNDILLRLSLAGLPHPHVATSDEALAKLGALTPDALLAAQTRSGLSGDLAVALRGIDGVTDARVVIAPATQAAFGDQDASPATASVSLSLRPGATLSADAVAGVRAFVADAVPGLTREHITLLNGHGLDMSATASQHDDAESIRISLQSALDTAFGAGTTIVRVHASYDERTRESHETDRLGVNGPPIASEGSDERLSNVQKHYSKRALTQDRGSILKDEHTIVPAGTQSRISVAVLVDEARGIDPRKVRELAAAAAGIDHANGDAVLVEPLRFAHPSAPSQAFALPWMLLLVSVLPPLAAIGALLFAGRYLCSRLWPLARALLDRENTRVTREAVSGFAPRQVHGALTGEPPHTAAAVISALPAATAAVVLDFYSPEERTAIIERMSRPVSAFLPPWETLVHGE